MYRDKNKEAAQHRNQKGVLQKEACESERIDEEEDWRGKRAPTD
jgi:hypothetical protein